jgi:hypothetical protein
MVELENMMNGLSMVKSDNGNVDFSNWGGLNEIVRYPEIAANHSPSEYALVELVVLFIKIPKPVNTERDSRLFTQLQIEITDKGFL